jgi:ribosome-associated protein
MGKIPVTRDIAISEDELEEEFVLASGPGGQNVNKVASAVQLRFDVAHSPSLPFGVRQRLAALAGRRLTKDGVLVIVARRHREQERNRAEARARLIALIRDAAIAPKPRRPTKPTKASKERRIDTKKRHSRLKKTRAKTFEE